MHRGVVALAVAGLCLAGSIHSQEPIPQVPLSRAAAAVRALEVSPELQARGMVEARARLGTTVPHLFNPQVRLEAEGERAGVGGREYTRRLTLEQELDLRGERGARRKVAAANLGLARAERAARSQQLRLDVEREAGTWMVLHRKRSLLDSLAVHARALLEGAQGAVRKETLAPFAARQLALDVGQLEGDRQVIAGALAAQTTRLRSLLHWPAGLELSFVDDLDRPHWECDPESIAALALRSRGTLAQTDAEESLLVAELGLQRRAGRVNPTLGVSIARERSSFDGADFTGRPDVLSGLTGLSKAETRWGLSLALPLPLSNRGQSEIARAEVELGRIRAERLALTAQVLADAQGTCANLDALQHRVDAAREPALGATEDLEGVEAAYRGGRISLQEYLTFRERLIAAGLRYLDAVEALEAARANLAGSVGLDMSTLDRRLSRP